MAQDIIITPSGGQIEWLNDATGVAMIDIDANNNLSITNSGGDLSIGDTASDVYIGDGTNNVDLIFEQNGSIRGTGSQTITLGQSGDTISVAGSTFNPQSDIVFTAADTRGMYLNNTSGNQVYVRLLGSTELDLGSDNRIRFVESDNGSVRAVFDLNSGKAKVGNGASETPVATWQIEDNNQSTTQTNFTQALDRAGLLIETGYTANAYTPGLFWMTNNNNASKPKAGIYLQLAGSGSRILFGTSNNYGTGLTNTAMVINESGSVGIVTQTLPTSNRFHVSSGSSGSASKSSIAVVSVADNSTFNNGTAALHVINSGNRGTKGNSIGSDLLRLEFSDGIHTIFNKDGSVGIGTTSPVKKLDVRAAASWDGIHIGSTAGSATAIDFARSTTHANPTARIGVAEPAATHTSDMRFFTSDASGGAPNLVEKMRIDQNGNVGIGTDAPTYSLHINRSTPSLTLETAANSNDPVITLKSNSAITNEGAQIWYDNSIGTLHIQTTYPSDAADIVFHTRTGADQSTGNVRMVIAGDGNVGIGTSTPSAKLHVVGPTLGSTLNVESKLLHIRSSLDGNTGHLEIKDVRTSAGTTWTTSGRRIQMKVDSTYMAYIQFNGTGNNYGLSFGAGASGSAPGNSAEAMRIVSSGSVGIGTTNPGDVLHVDGNTIIGDTDRDSIVLTLKAQNTAGAPAATTKLVMQGYEGRGIGTFYEDSSYSGKEWFCGMNYSAAFAFWNVGYDASGGQAEYNANTLFRIRNTGRVEMLNYGSGTFTGTAAYKLAVDSSGNIIETAVGSGQVDGSGTANYITRWSDTDTIGNSNIFDNGNIGVGTAADLNGKVNISAQGNSEGDQHIFCQLSHSAVNHGAAIFLKTSTSNLNNRYGVRIRAIRNANNNAAADLAFSLENSGATALAEVVRFTSDGHVGIGTTNPSNYSNTAARDLVINRADHAGITIYNNAASKSGNIYFADAGSLFAGFISYTHSNNNMLFGANATTIMTLSEDNVDLTGDLTVGGTATVGENVNAAGLVVKRASGQSPYLQFNIGANREAYIQASPNVFTIANDNANDIYFKTNAADNMVLQHSGNLYSQLGGTLGTSASRWSTIYGSAGDFSGHINISNDYGIVWGGGNSRPYIIGNKTNGTIVFGEGGSEHLRINTNGNVGIGTTAPTAHLHVSKASGATTVLTQVAANSTVGFEIKKTGSTTQHWKIVDGQTVNGTLEFYDATDSATRMAINGNGKVGIGTNAPNKTFQVNWSSSDTTITTGNGLAGGQAGAGALIQNTSSTAGIYANLDFRAYDADARIAVKKAAANTADFYFIQDNNTTFTTNMVIRANGSVGIGTTNPGSRLEVHNGNVQIKNTGSNSFKFFGIKFGPAPYFLDGTRIFEWETLNSAGSSTLSKFALAIDSDGNALICNGTSGYTPRIAINASTGNVGIGTTAHGSYKHYVYGSTGASGTKYFDMPHPDPSKKADGYRLRHGAVEAPAFGENLYRFTVTIPSDEGTVTTDLPGYFTFLNENPQIWIQARNMFARAYGEINEGLTSFTVTGEKTGQYDVLIIGSRKAEASDKDGQVFTAEYKD